MSSPNELVAQENEKTNSFHENTMLISAFVIITVLPLQICSSGQLPLPLNKPLAVAAFIDTATILGFPELRLRDGKGRLYVADKILMQEPLARIQDSAGIAIISQTNKRKAYIAAYLRR